MPTRRNEPSYVLKGDSVWTVGLLAKANKQTNDIPPCIEMVRCLLYRQPLVFNNQPITTNICLDGPPINESKRHHSFMLWLPKSKIVKLKPRPGDNEANSSVRNAKKQPCNEGQGWCQTMHFPLSKKINKLMYIYIYVYNIIYIYIYISARSWIANEYNPQVLIMLNYKQGSMNSDNT